jgi:Mycobacterium membrane protein
MPTAADGMDLRLDLFAEKTAGGPAGGDQVRAISIGGLFKRWWIPLLLVVVLAVSGLVVSRLHKLFGSEDLNANAGAGIKIVQFNPKVVKYEVDGPPGSVANINYWDADANVYDHNTAGRHHS